MSLIELSVLSEYEIDPKKVASVAGTASEDPGSLFVISSHANQDGSLTSIFQIYGKHKNSCVLANFKDNETRFQELSTSVLSDKKTDWRSGKMDENALIITNSNEVILIPKNGLGTPVQLKISNQISDFIINNQVSAAFRPYRSADLIGSNGIVPIPLETGDCEPKRLAFLHINETYTTAHWQQWINEKDSTIKKSWLQKVFSNQKTDQNVLSEKDLSQLSPSDFPASHRQPMFEQAIIKNNQVYTYVMDRAFNSLKWGFNFSTLVTINETGRKLSAIYWDDHNRHKNEKKYGVSGKFSSSGRYCILKSVYDSTSEWKAKQRLLDLDTKALIEIKLPKGYTAYTLIDHIDGYFWLYLNDQTDLKFVCCKQE